MCCIFYTFGGLTTGKAVKLKFGRSAFQTCKNCTKNAVISKADPIAFFIKSEKLNWPLNNADQKFAS